MDLLKAIWIVIDSILVVIFFFRKKITKHENMMRRPSIEKNERFGNVILRGLTSIFVGLIAYVVLHFFKDTWIQKFLGWYIGIFVAGLCSMLFDWVKEEKYYCKSVWSRLLTIYAVLLSVIVYMIGTDNIMAVTENRIILDILIAIFAIICFNTVLEIQKNRKEYCSIKLSEKGIRKDLYNRTPGLAENISNIELIKNVEIYFHEYMSRYRKIKEIRTIEYVYLEGKYRDLWCEKAARLMKKFAVLSTFIVIIDVFLRKSPESLKIIAIICVFKILIILYKHFDLECLYKIGIRYFYDIWGYYLTCTGKNKFVGTVQLIDTSKFHKYIYSFLDIVALCRTVAFGDKFNEEKRICIVARNLSELFENYSDCNENKNWIMFIPLWTAALFEFDVTGMVNDDVKSILTKSVNKDIRFDISIFLQSFWADIQSKNLEDGIGEYIYSFERELFD